MDLPSSSHSLGDDRVDRITLSWFATVRWTTVLAGVGAVFAGSGTRDTSTAITTLSALTLCACAASNVWLTWRVQRPYGRNLRVLAPLLMCADIGLISWLLVSNGGVLNPASVFYLVEIVVAALVFGRWVTWTIAGLAVTGYATLFLAPTADLVAAQVMHPEIAVHMRGMWLAFVLTTIVIAAIVTRLSVAIERRDRALESLRERNDRATRAASLATLAAGAAHELSTPLATIAVAAHELVRTIDGDPEAARRDARLIRSETNRCRAILDAMASQAGHPSGESPKDVDIRDLLDLVQSRMPPEQRTRLDVSSPDNLRVLWPVESVARALGNLIQNAVQASPDGARVALRVVAQSDGRVTIEVRDAGEGMSADQLTRIGEPFYTTKPPGKGTGLGVFVAKSTIEQLGGSLSIVSAKGAGTNAKLELPRDLIRSTQESA